MSRASLLLLLFGLSCSAGEIGPAENSKADYAQAVLEYYEEMSVPKPFIIRTGEDFKAHQKQLREKILECMGLWPLPERVPLDIHESEPIDHPWCTIKKVYYQIWPKVYSGGVLYMPKEFAEKPAPAVLCVHGHWNNGYADHQVQKRCLVLAKKGFVVFSPPQDHEEDLTIGMSHQSHHVWRNMRGIDYLQSLEEVDDKRIGVCGASGGGLQTQMIVGLDERVKAATIVGLTCDYREIMFPYMAHCNCNHFPNIMRYTDQPEISALGLPAAVQYLTMNDWTRHFGADNFPTIQNLYKANGVWDRVDSVYFPTAHLYDKRKRERTYWWMEKWVRGNKNAALEEEPDDITIIYPEKTLIDLSVSVGNNKGLDELKAIFRRKYHYKNDIPEITSKKAWKQYKDKMTARLKDLLGEGAKLERKIEKAREISRGSKDGLVIERIEYPTEGSMVVPTLLFYEKKVEGKLPVVVMLAEGGQDELFSKEGERSATDWARKGYLVALPDIRFLGEMSLAELSDNFGPEKLKFQMASSSSIKKDKKSRVYHTLWGWWRDSVLWGRSMAGMGVTDIQAVLDGVAERGDTDMHNVTVIARDSGLTATMGLLAGVLDERISRLDLDFNNSCFERNNNGYHAVRGNDSEKYIPLVARVLRYGDILQWSVLLADRKLTMHRVPKQAGDTQWLANIFKTIGNPKGLTLVAK